MRFRFPALRALAHLGALILVRDFVETIQEQEHVQAILEQLNEKIGRQIEVVSLLIRRYERKWASVFSRAGEFPGRLRR